MEEIEQSGAGAPGLQSNCPRDLHANFFRFFLFEITDSRYLPIDSRELFH
jgi:hypothetical protein